MQKEWIGTIEKAVRDAANIGEFRENLDPAQVAFVMLSILQGFHLYERMFRERNSEIRARAAFESLIVRARHPDTFPAAADEAK
jgi:hypothetical protein